MKKYLTNISLFLIFIATVFYSCGGSSDSSGSIPTNTAPTNLIIGAEVVGTDAQNPDGDGSGIVNFAIKATGATSYTISFGNGESKTNVTNGNFAYTYNTPGTTAYTVTVSAYKSGQFISKTAQVKVKFAGDRPLLFSDEFNIDGAPDASKWNFQVWDPGRVNDELQSYTTRPENTIVQGGFLKIKAIREKYGKGDFTSGRIESNGKFDFTYGKIEIRAKVPTGVGTWPAVWMLGSDIGTNPWPACGEIDILESVGKNLDQNHSSLHSPGRSGNTPDTGIIKVPNSNTEFHIYTAEWTATNIKFSVDGVQYYDFKNNNTFPFNKNFYLIVNVAMGGIWGGAVDPNFTSSTMEVDYIRVYK